jgi:hypothetical protein
MVYPCNVDQSVQIYNECNYYKFVWTSGDDTGRIDYIPKKDAVLQQVNTDEFWIRSEDHTLYLKYSEIDQTQPTDHTTQDQLMNILLRWACIDDSNDPGDTGKDSFGRTRVAHCVNLFNAQYRYDAQPLLYNTLLTAGGTVAQSTTPAPATYLDTTTTGSAGANTDRAVFQTKEYLPYQADSTMYVVIGATLRTVKVVPFNTTRLGYFDDANDKNISADIGGSGAFFELDPDGTVYAVLRKFLSGTQSDVKVAQADWNLDQMDGTGASLVNIDFTKAQLYCFEFEMNSSRVRLGFNINGGVVWAHQFLIYNLLDEPTLFNYTLPIRAEIVNSAGLTDTQVAGHMHIYSESADLCGNTNSSNNGYNSNPFNFCEMSKIDCPAILHTLGDHRPLIAIRMKKTLCRASIWPKRIDIDNETGAMVLWRLILNPTGLTPTWTNVSSNSFAEFSTIDNNVTIGSNSVVLACGYTSTTFTKDVEDLFDTFGLHASIDGNTPDVLALTVEYVRGSGRVRGSLSWIETK